MNVLAVLIMDINFHLQTVRVDTEEMEFVFSIEVIASHIYA